MIPPHALPEEAAAAMMAIVSISEVRTHRQWNKCGSSGERFNQSETRASQNMAKREEFSPDRSVRARNCE